MFSKPAPHESLKPKRRRGMALLVVSVLIVIVALAAYEFNQRMADAYRSTSADIERVQARLAAESGLQLLLTDLELPRASRSISNDANTFPQAAISITQDEFDSSSNESATLSLVDDWSVAIVAPRVQSTNTTEASVLDMRDQAGTYWRWGTVNESAKLNLTVLKRWDQLFPGHARKSLLRLPGAQPEFVDAFLESYHLEHPRPNDSRAENIREKIASNRQSPFSLASQWSLLWTGGDWDCDYQIDDLEQTLNARVQRAVDRPSTEIPAVADRGMVHSIPVAWRDYLTFCSGQRNENRNGVPRVFLNEEDLATLHSELQSVWPTTWCNYVVAVRQFGLHESSSVSSADATSVGTDTWTPVFSNRAVYKIDTVLDLVDSSVVVKDSAGTEVLLTSPFSTVQSLSQNALVQLLDDVTTNPNPVVDGQIDVLTASAEVLGCIPNLSSAGVDAIIRGRQSSQLSKDARGNLAWLLQNEVLDISELKQILPWITVGGDCRSCQVIGFRDARSAVFRCTTILDARSIPATLAGTQQWHQWGRGFEISALKADFIAKTPSEDPL